MDTINFTSSISWGDLVAQIPFILLIAAMMRSRLSRVRVLVSAAALVGLFHAVYWPGDKLMVLWWGLLLGATLLLLGRRLYENTQVRFSEEEAGMLAGLLSVLPRNRARHFLDQGFWLTGHKGDVLTREGEAVSHLFYLASGEAKVTSHGRQVGTCRAGDLIGEVTILSGEQASATVTIDSPSRFWCAPASVLRPYLDAHDDVRRAIEQGFTASLRAKLRASNERIAGAGEAAA